MITSKRTSGAVVGTAVVVVSTLSGTLIACSPEETSNDPRPARHEQTAKPKPSTTVMVRPDADRDRDGVRVDIKPQGASVPDWTPRRPKEAASKRPTPRRTLVKPSVRTAPPAPARHKPAVVTTTIRAYVSCPLKPQVCIDKGSLTLYASNKILAGHDYMGYAYLAQLPVGRKVVVTSGAVRGTYQVYAHKYLARKSGSVPSYVYNSALTLQSCHGSGTSFSLLKRVS